MIIKQVISETFYGSSLPWLSTENDMEDNHIFAYV